MILFLLTLSILCLFHSYLFYPFLLKKLTTNKKNNKYIYTIEEDLPHLYILLAAYNEEQVIGEKLKSIFDTNYPLDHITLLIGSDNSTDQTEAIVQTFQAKYPQIRLFSFEGRNGKVRILNQLVQKHFVDLYKKPTNLLILTDANVIFTPDTLYQLAKHFKNPSIGLVAANILNRNVHEKGIAQQEEWYIQRENDIKYMEGKYNGNMMGAFGACYAMSARLFRPIPSHFIVDDFYLSMLVIEQEYQAIKEPDAICWEDVSTDWREEFKRKKRISAGNFQNLKRFKKLLNPLTGFTAFAFFSHKLLRWLGPLCIITAFITTLLLFYKNYFYLSLLILQVLGLLSPLMDYLLEKVGIKNRLLRFISYFYMMNWALLIGLFNYLKGIKTNVWQPTQRNI